jgi:alkylation response protein AidB-like acyl-CoA dehydrogenase
VNPAIHAIRVHGHLDDHWSGWFGGLTVTRNSDGTSTLAGTVTDQAQLYGALAGLRDIGATLIDVRTGPSEAPYAWPMPLLDDIDALVPSITATAAATERDRAVPEPIVAGLADAGVFRLAAPKAAGGLEVDPATMYEVFERLGTADGSTGWCAMIGGATSVVLGYLAPETAADLLADPRFLVAGVAAPAGRATPVPGGYRVTGRWGFASASQQSTWLVGGCLVVEDGAPRPVMVVLPAAEVTVHDTWDAVGLCGTGSHDMAVEDVFVPTAHTFSLAAPPASPHGRFPVLSFLALGVGAVSLGIAQAAIDEFTRAAPAKVNPMTGQSAAARPAARTALAEAVALRSAARAFLLDEIDHCWSAASGGDPVTPQRVARLRLAITTATTMAADAVGRLYRAAGGSSVHRGSPLQRHFRDVHVATQHALVNADTLELTGAVLLGEQVNTLRL